MKFELFDKTSNIYSSMINDISSAKKYVYLESYIFRDDSIGYLFKVELLKKAKEKVKIIILLDSWGSNVKKDYFKELIKEGAKVVFFKKFIYGSPYFFRNNHQRNHRKLLIIDDKITYIGSANIGYEFLSWRELMIRIDSEEISKKMADFFVNTFNISRRLYLPRPVAKINKEFEIISDSPNYFQRTTEKRFRNLIDLAKKEILILTPYFVPPKKIRRAFSKAIKRGVKINLIIPYQSNKTVVNIIRNRYLGTLYKQGLNIFYYKLKNLHSKLLIIDSDYFLMGSSNLDYRSFRHLYEVNLIGKNPKMIRELKKIFYEDLNQSVEFNYNDWKHRSSLRKIFELILSNIEHQL